MHTGEKSNFMKCNNKKLRHFYSLKFINKGYMHMTIGDYKLEIFLKLTYHQDLFQFFLEQINRICAVKMYCCFGSSVL